MPATAGESGHSSDASSASNASTAASHAALPLVLASNNAKKLSELRALLAGVPLVLHTQDSFGVSEAAEPHHSFIENALAKARHAAQATGRAAIADDSGLCVDALGGAPGVVSAHFAGLVQPLADREQTRRWQDQSNNQQLLRSLQALPHQAVAARGQARPAETPPGHSARFVCTLVAVRSAADPEPLVAVGRWHGRILAAPRGAHGFGYDPLMYIPALNATVAELDDAQKNTHSHRALAAAQMCLLMQDAWQSAWGAGWLLP